MMYRGDNMKFVLYDKNYRIKNTDIIGNLIDCVYREDKKMNLYVLEEEHKDETGRFPLHDVWETEIEEIVNTAYNFKKTECDFLKQFNFEFAINKNMTDKQLFQVIETLEYFLQEHGITDDRENELGIIAVNILTKIANEDKEYISSKEE